jgi:hypothetical protein
MEKSIGGDQLPALILPLQPDASGIDRQSLFCLGEQQ